YSSYNGKTYPQNTYSRVVYSNLLAPTHSSNAPSSPGNSTLQSPLNPLSVQGVGGVKNAEATIAMLREQLAILQATVAASGQTAFTSGISNTNRSPLQLTPNGSAFADVC